MPITKNNIVLDIDATLVHTHGDIEDFSMLKIYSDNDRIKYRRKLYRMKLIDVVSVSGAGSITTLSGIYRPYLREFLDFCFDYFDNIIIWSAGKKKYVEKMCEIMFPFQEQQPMLIYTYDDCIIGEEDYLKKPLKKLYKDPRTKGKLNEKNTFVLDDRDDTFSLNEKNGIMIPEFESDMSIEDITEHEDKSFLQLMAWLSIKEVKDCKDVRKLKKDKIFKKNVNDYQNILKKEKYK
jgi:hypothetical protein